MGIICAICGQEIGVKEEHYHTPDIYLNVWDCKFSLMKCYRDGNGAIISKELPFSIPTHWVDWILNTSGGSINMSGMYRLPGMVWEWCMANLRGEVNIAKFIAKKIDNYLTKIT